MTKDEILKQMKEKFDKEAERYMNEVSKMINSKELNIHTFDEITSNSINNIRNEYKDTGSLLLESVSDEKNKPNCKKCHGEMKLLKKNKR